MNRNNYATIYIGLLALDLTEVPLIHALTAQMLLTKIGRVLFRFFTQPNSTPGYVYAQTPRSAATTSFPLARTQQEIEQPSRCK
jgi:hypothetical protein